MGVAVPGRGVDRNASVGRGRASSTGVARPAPGGRDRLAQGRDSGAVSQGRSRDAAVAAASIPP